MTRLLSPILAEVSPGYVAFWCPGCEEAHCIPVSSEHRPNRNWAFNGDAEAPTLSPSILVRSGHFAPHATEGDCWCKPRPDAEEWGFKCRLCHSFVEEGRIRFLNDCSHALAGQTVDLPPYPVERRGE